MRRASGAQVNGRLNSLGDGGDDALEILSRLEIAHEQGRPWHESPARRGSSTARREQPAMHVIYHLIQQPQLGQVDDYRRAKVAEAYAEAADAGFEPRETAAVQRESQRRLSERQQSQQ